MTERITLEELAARTGEGAVRLEEWSRRGLIVVTDDGLYPEDAVERVRLVQLALRRGFSLDDIVRANDGQDLLSHYLEHLFPNGIPRTYSRGEAAEATGVDVGLLRRVWQAAGLVDQGDVFYEEDLEMLRNLSLVLGTGLPEDALLQGLRVMTDAMNRVAETEVRLIHFYLHDPLRTSGMPEDKIIESVDASIKQLQPLVQPALAYFHDKGIARATRDDIMMHFAEEAGIRPASAAAAEMPSAILFVDLCSFTPLTAQMGDAAAAAVLDRFAELVRTTVIRWEGKVVKQIGDAFMLVFPDPRLAVACALEMEKQASDEPQFPSIRSGIHWGSVIFRDGDYVGANVNMASRLTSAAERHQVLVSTEVRQRCGELPGATFVPLGRKALKGIDGAVELFEARSQVLDNAAARENDPVCGLELSESEAAVHLKFGSVDHWFCSEDCLRKFIDVRSGQG